MDTLTINKESSEAIYIQLNRILTSLVTSDYQQGMKAHRRGDNQRKNKTQGVGNEKEWPGLEQHGAFSYGFWLILALPLVILNGAQRREGSGLRIEKTSHPIARSFDFAPR